MPGEETNHSRQIYPIFIGYLQFSGLFSVKQSPRDASERNCRLLGSAPGKRRLQLRADKGKKWTAFCESLILSTRLSYRLEKSKIEGVGPSPVPA